MKCPDHKKMNALGLMIVFTEISLFSGCAGIKPTVKYQPEQQQATPRRYSCPHEAAPIRAGEERVLLWTPELKTDIYTIRTSLVYDLNRYNERVFTDEIRRHFLVYRLQSKWNESSEK